MPGNVVSLQLDGVDVLGIDYLSVTARLNSYPVMNGAVSISGNVKDAAALVGRKATCNVGDLKIFRGTVVATEFVAHPGFARLSFTATDNLAKLDIAQRSRIYGTGEAAVPIA